MPTIGRFKGIGLHTTIDQAIKDSGVVEGSSLHKHVVGLKSRILQCKSDSTNYKYFGAFKRWERFITAQGFPAVPANSIHICLYLNSLLTKGSSFAVVSSAVYAIKWAHSLNGLSDPTTNIFVKNLLEASKRIAKKPVCKKDSVTSGILIRLCDIFSESSDLLVVRDLTMILLSFSGFLRYNELSNLHCSDVKLSESYFTLVVRKSKTDQYRFGSEIVISKGETTACPYDMLMKYIRIARIDIESDDFLFKPIYRSGSVCGLIHKNKPLSYTGAKEAILKRLNFVSEGKNFGLHSLRSGGASMAANNGVNDRCFKRHGRWRSESSKDGYIADSIERRLNVTQKLGI
ncbi:uncharacterized protein LOC117321479 [Pecten maximus]|uniref:uncharacterized protein LOC117321479 n=1 Tax=Pecten maximus TaxID=6579 RepID=UPI001458087D|nr:uncharacterized protein LOC117321479 [Pecten maximus]